MPRNKISEQYETAQQPRLRYNLAWKYIWYICVENRFASFVVILSIGRKTSYDVIVNYIFRKKDVSGIKQRDRQRSIVSMK